MAVNRKNYLDNSEVGTLTRQELRRMELDNSFNTESSYSANTALYPNNLISFVDKHMSYLNEHKNVDPQQYLSNLRLMSKLR